MIEEQKMKLLIAGYYGFGNIGDEAILASILKILHQINDEIEITVVGGDKRILEMQYDLHAISWDDDNGVFEGIRSNDYVILGGGGLINDYWGFDIENLLPSKGGLASYLSIPFYANLAGKPCMLLSAGIGPFTDPDQRASIAEIINLFDVLSVRDRYSYDQLTQLLKSASLTRQVEIVGDPAFIIEPKGTPTNQTSSTELNNPNFRIGLNLRYWGDRLLQDQLEETIAKVLDQYLEIEPVSTCLFIPFQSIGSNPLTDDLSVLTAVRERMVQKDRVSLLEDQLLPEEMCAVIRQCNLFIGMRYHANLFALKSGIPSLGLVYDPKIRELFKFFNQEQFALSMENWNRKNFFELVNKLSEQQETGNPPSSFDQLIEDGLNRTEDLLIEFLSYTSPKETDVTGIYCGIFNRYVKALDDYQIEVADKDIKISELSNANHELNEQVAQLHDTVSEHISKIEDLEFSIHKQKETIEELNEVLQDAQATNQSHIQREKGLREKISRLENWYDQEKRLRLSIQSTIGYKALSMIWRLGGVLLPEGTRRRRLYFRVKKYLRKVLNGIGINRTSGFHLTTSVGQAVSPVVIDQIIGHLFNSNRSNSDTWPIIIQSTTPLSPYNTQRSAQFAHELSLRGNTVLYSYWRWDKVSQPKIEKVDQNLLELPLDLFLGGQEKIINNLKDGEGLLLLEYPNPDFFETLAIASGKGWLLIYDIIDDWEGFHRVGQAPWYDLDFERYLIHFADLVIAVNQQLANKARELGAKEVLIIPNGYDPNIEVSSSKVELDRGTITLGYFGHLTSDWFDWDLVSSIADERDEWLIHLVGESNPTELPELPENIVLHSKVRWSDLAAYAENWDVAIIPFKDIPLSHAADPIKAYEYSALRLPVVMTGCHVPSGAEGWMLRADDYKGFIYAVERLMNLDLNLHAIDEFLAASTWSSRVDHILLSVSCGEQRIEWTRALMDVRK